jgi:hypothetical protein
MTPEHLASKQDECLFDMSSELLYCGIKRVTIGTTRKSFFIFFILSPPQLGLRIVFFSFTVENPSQDHISQT